MLEISLTLSGFALSAVGIALVPLFIERGVAPATAAWACLGGLGQTLGRTLYTTLARRSGVTTRTVVLIATGGATTALLAAVPGPVPLLIALAVLAGMVRGNLTLLQATAVTDRWGTAAYGRLSATLAAPITVVGALAPFAGAALAGLWAAMVACCRPRMLLHCRCTLRPGRKRIHSRGRTGSWTKLGRPLTPVPAAGDVPPRCGPSTPRRCGTAPRRRRAGPAPARRPGSRSPVPAAPPPCGRRPLRSPPVPITKPAAGTAATASGQPHGRTTAPASTASSKMMDRASASEVLRIRPSQAGDQTGLHRTRPVP